MLKLAVLFVLGLYMLSCEGASVNMRIRSPRSPQGWRGSFSPYGTNVPVKPGNTQPFVPVYNYDVRMGKKSPFLDSSQPVSWSGTEKLNEKNSFEFIPVTDDGFLPSRPLFGNSGDQTSKEVEEKSYAEPNNLPPGSFYIPAVGEKEGEYYSKTKQSLYIHTREPQEPFPVQTQVILVHEPNAVRPYSHEKEDDHVEDSQISATGHQETYKPLQNVRAFGGHVKNHSYVAVPANAMMLPPPTRPTEPDFDLLMTVYPNLPKLLPQSQRVHGVKNVQQPKTSSGGKPPSGGTMSVIHDSKVVTPAHGYLPATLTPAPDSQPETAEQPSKAATQPRGKDPTQTERVKLNDANENRRSTNQSKELNVQYFSFNPADISPFYNQHPVQDNGVEVITSTASTNTRPPVKYQDNDSIIGSSDNVPVIYGKSAEQRNEETSDYLVVNSASSANPVKAELPARPTQTEGPELITAPNNQDLKSSFGESFDIQVQTAFRVPGSHHSDPEPVSYSVPKPVSYSDPKSVSYSDPNPVRYSDSEPVSYSVPKPVSYSVPVQTLKVSKEPNFGEEHLEGQQNHPEMFGDFKPIHPDLVQPVTTAAPFPQDSSAVLHSDEETDSDFADPLEDSLSSGSEHHHERIEFRVQPPQTQTVPIPVQISPQNKTEITLESPEIRKPSTQSPAHQETSVNATATSADTKNKADDVHVEESTSKVVLHAKPDKDKSKKPTKLYKPGKLSPKGVMYTVIQGHSKVKFFGYNPLHGKMKHSHGYAVNSEDSGPKTSVFFPVKTPKADTINKRQSAPVDSAETKRVRPVFFAKRPGNGSPARALRTSTTASVVSDPFEYVSQLQKIGDAKGRILHRSGA